MSVFMSSVVSLFPSVFPLSFFLDFLFVGVCYVFFLDCCDYVLVSFRSFLELSLFRC